MSKAVVIVIIVLAFIGVAIGFVLTFIGIHNYLDLKELKDIYGEEDSIKTNKNKQRNIHKDS